MNIEVKISVKPIDYRKSMEILEQRVRDVSLGKKSEFLWIFEHDHTYTAGTSSKDTDLLDKTLNVIKTNRGGKYTYHGPGQKIVYFVLNLNKIEKSKKIAAIGFRVKKWIAYHGFALNISTDLSKYNGIVPCGIKNKGITSLKNMGINNFININTIIVKKFLSTFR